MTFFGVSNKTHPILNRQYLQQNFKKTYVYTKNKQ